MAVVVGVHGIGQEHKGPEQLHVAWWPPLSDGLRLAGTSIPAEGLVCASYGDLFRPPGSARAQMYHYTARDVNEVDAELLGLLWQEAARVDPGVRPPDAVVRASTPKSVQSALGALARSRFFAGLAEKVFIGSLKQVTRYLLEPVIRDEAQKSVDAVVGSETTVLVGHSLGSVVAYEALHRFAEQANWANVRTLVTLGSPLGIPHIIFDRLVPKPDGRGSSQRVDRWSNVSDDGDVVALVKRLRPLFGEPVVDLRIDNGADAHDVAPYLSAVETGRVIAAGLRRSGA
jgi:hypothetical protein